MPATETKLTAEQLMAAFQASNADELVRKMVADAAKRSPFPIQPGLVKAIQDRASKRLTKLQECFADFTK